MRKQVLLIVIFITSFFLNSVFASEPFNLTSENLNEFVEFVLCNYEPGVSAEDLSSYLESLLEESNSECGAPEPTRVISTPTSEEFVWSAISGADDYMVAKFGLTDEDKSFTTTTEVKYTFEDVTGQPYLFSFRSSCSWGNSTVSIIIIDKNLGLVSGDFGSCRCSSFDVLSVSDFCYLEEGIQYDETFHWDNSCTIQKYEFNMFYNLDGTPTHETFYLNKILVNENKDIMQWYSCNELELETEPDLVFNTDYSVVSIQSEFADVLFNSYGIHFDVLEELSEYQIVAKTCGCGGGAKSDKSTEQSDELIVSPNPFQDYLNIRSNQYRLEDSQMTIYDVYGKKVAIDFVENNNANASVQLNVSHLSDGIYFLVINNNDQIQSQKIVKL